MKRSHVVVAATMMVVGAAGVVVGVVEVAAGDAALVGLVGIGALVAVLGAVLLRDAARAARVAGGPRRRKPEDSGGYGVYPGPTGDVGSEWHGDRQRDGGDGSGGDSGGGWSGWGWSSGDSGGGSSSGDSGGGWSGGGDSGGGGGS
jgi:hypothetical protein